MKRRYAFQWHPHATSLLLERHSLRWRAGVSKHVVAVGNDGATAGCHNARRTSNQRRSNQNQRTWAGYFCREVRIVIEKAVLHECSVNRSRARHRRARDRSEWDHHYRRTLISPPAAVATVKIVHRYVFIGHPLTEVIRDAIRKSRRVIGDQSMVIRGGRL